MKITVSREDKNSSRTIGMLSIDGKFMAYTLEDPITLEKIAGHSAIPAGTYQVVINHSQRFNRPLPLLLGVPRYEGVRIHPGNTARDTAGCILVGLSRTSDRLLHSRIAIDKIQPHIQAALDAGEEVWITIN